MTLRIGWWTKQNWS